MTQTIGANAAHAAIARGVATVAAGSGAILWPGFVLHDGSHSRKAGVDQGSTERLR